MLSTGRTAWLKWMALRLFQNLSFILILARHKPSQQLSKIHRLNRDWLVEPFQGRPNTSDILAWPESVNSIFRKLSTQVTNVRIHDVTMVQVRLCWQSLITRPLNKMLDFVWHPELPKTLPEFLLIFYTWATCIGHGITRNNQFIGVASSEHTRGGLFPSNTIRGLP